MFGKFKWTKLRRFYHRKKVWNNFVNILEIYIYFIRRYFNHHLPENTFWKIRGNDIYAKLFFLVRVICGDEENEKISSKDNWKNMLISLFLYYTANNKILIFVGFFPLSCIIIKYYTFKYVNVSGEKFTSLLYTREISSKCRTIHNWDVPIRIKPCM